jgi:hemerythrin
LIWALRLHLRLEERWLKRHGCLCPGHRGAHRDVLAQACADLMRTTGDRQGRFAWLQELQQWLIGHCQGPDATAYAAASTAEPTAEP